MKGTEGMAQENEGWEGRSGVSDRRGERGKRFTMRYTSTGKEEQERRETKGKAQGEGDREGRYGVSESSCISLPNRKGRGVRRVGERYMEGELEYIVEWGV